MNLRMILDRTLRLSSTTILSRFARKSNHNSHFYKNICTIIVGISLLSILLIAYRLLKIAGDQNDIVYQPIVLDDVDAFPTKILSSDLSEADSTNSSCTFFGCFDVYRCGSRGNKLLVYVYPPVNYVDSTGKPIAAQMTREFNELLQAVVSSKFYTPNPREACIFVPSVDTLNQNRLNIQEVSRSLRTLEFWNDGENHLIFNMIPGSVPDYNTVLDVALGKAMIAGAGFSSLTYRSGFDTSIPVYSPLTVHIRANTSRPRTWFAVSTQMNINVAFEQDLMEVRAAHPNDLLLLGPCLQYNPINGSIRCTGQNVYKYVDVLESATFCLVMRGARLGQSVLVEALAAGCIPVVVSDSVVMPFHGYIDWMRAAVFVREVDILTVIQTLKKISEKRIVEMQSNCIWLFEKYFETMEKITETTLEIMEDRVFPHLARDYAHWNLPQRGGPRGHLNAVRSITTFFTYRSFRTIRLDGSLILTSHFGLMSPLFASVTAPKIRGFTAVILTYDRQELLFSLIVKLAKVPSLSKVLVIWNNQHKDPPPPSRWPRVTKSLKVIQTKQNKLSNRFYPYDEIETEAILSIDDDIIMLTVDEVEFAYEVWREFPDRIVGFPSRTHTWDNVTNCWRYESEWTNRISMVLTGAAFHHKFWSYMYTTAMPGDIKTWVDDHMNCEDIAMNFLVANVTGKAPIKVTPKKKFRCPECTNTEMLSADLTHMVERTQCINRFSEIYETMPLRSVEFRADPVLFKDQFPDKLKRFKEIGSL